MYLFNEYIELFDVLDLSTVQGRLPSNSQPQKQKVMIK